MEEFDTTKLTYRIQKVRLLDDEPQWLFLNKSNNSPSPVISLYYPNSIEAKNNGHDSQERVLRSLFYLFTWADKVYKPVDELILSNKVFDEIDLNKFSHWLRQRGTKVKDVIDGETYIKRIDGGYFEQVISDIYEFLVWSVGFLYLPPGYKRNSAELLEQQAVVKDMTKEWAKKAKKLVPKDVKDVNDLTDDEIIKIDFALHPANRNDAGRAIVIRDYLIWRIAIEFGVRKGEILCLEVDDLPEGSNSFLNIRRIEDRGDDYIDERSNPPKVKTLSRILDQLFPDAPYSSDGTLKCPHTDSVLKYSHVKHWVTEYLGWHRPIDAKHKFVFVRHDSNTATPLASLQQLCDKIKELPGLGGFHFHLTRHSFFNRLFATKIDSEYWDRDKADIQYYGGWSSDKSIEVYTSRARKTKARKYHTRYQIQESSWKKVKDHQE